VIQLLWLEDVTTGKIYGGMTVQYDNKCTSQWKVYEGMEKC